MIIYNRKSEIFKTGFPMYKSSLFRAVARLLYNYKKKDSFESILKLYYRILHNNYRNIVNFFIPLSKYVI